MYFIYSLLMMLGGFIIYKNTGEFDYLFKMLLIACAFALCDSISDLSPKKIIEAVANYKTTIEDKKDQK